VFQFKIFWQIGISPIASQKAVGPLTVKDLAGHRSLNTTMRYIKIEDKEQAEAIDRLEFGLL